MGAASEILNLLEAETPVQEITRRYVWPLIPLEDREVLFAHVEAGGELAQPALRLMAQMTLAAADGDTWDELRVLSLGIRCLGWSAGRKVQVLNQIERLLESLDRLFYSATPELRLQCIRYRAGYLMLRAQVAIEQDDLGAAIIYAKQAHNLYVECKDRKTAAEIVKTLRLWEDLYETRGSLVPFENIQDEKNRMLKELADLEKQRRSKTVELAELEQALQQMNKDLARLAEELQSGRDQAAREIEALRHEAQAEIERQKAAAQAELQKSQSVLEKLQRQAQAAEQQVEELRLEVHKHHVVMEFFQTLTRRACAPLWLEVVRLGLAQGTIDRLTEELLERLALKYPAETGELLCEVLARQPNYSPEKAGRVGGAVNAWMLKLRQAEKIRTTQPLESAQMLVDAWQVFLEGE